MAVGKGSMERASRAAGKTTQTKGATADKTTEAKGAATAKTTGKTSKGRPKASAPKKAVVAAPDQETLSRIVYPESKDMLYRDALPNERFEVGDAMPVYYY